MEGVDELAKRVPGDTARPEPPVLSNRNFLLLWLSLIGAQTAQNAILFTLLVLVVERTGSTTQGSLLVLSYIAPTIFFGAAAGLLVDRWRKERVLMITSLLRAVCAIAFLLLSDRVEALYLVVLAFATLGQFFNTAQAASIPSLVPERQLMSANSLWSMAVTSSQFGGMVIVAPILIKSYGSDAVFVVAAVLFLAATAMSRLLPYIEAHATTAFSGARSLVIGSLGEMGRTLRLLRSDSTASIAMMHMAVSSSLVLFFAVLVPRYMQAILQLAPDDAVYIFAPTGVGAIVGLRALPSIANRFGKGRVVIYGLVGLGASLIAMGFIESIASLLEGTENLNPFGDRRLGGISILVGLTMALSCPLGFAYALVNAPAQTVLHERAPAEMRGRIFASQLVLANLVSIGPLILVGAVADLYGVSPVLLSMAVLILLVAAISAYQGGREHARALAAAASDGPLTDREGSSTGG
jgi:MFS family permease